MEELLKDFLAETSEQLEAIGAQLVRFEREPSDARILANVFRVVHAIKGTCGFLNLPRLEKFAHAAESLIEDLREDPHPGPAHVSAVLSAIDRIKFLLGEIAERGEEPPGDDGKLIAEFERYKSAPPADAGLRRAPAATELALALGPAPLERRADTVRISVKTLEKMTALVQELTLARNQIEDAARFEKNQRIRDAVRRLSSVAAELRVSVFAARMQPVERLFANLHRVVRDLSGELGKQVEFVAEGGGVELDRQLIEAVRDPLTHLIRNAVDHGLETPDERRAAGKPETGLLRVFARREAADVSIVVSDDGRGMDSARIRERAVSLGLGSRERIESLREDEALRLVFLPSFTTAGRVSTISGRGVGLDIVRTNIESVGGTIALESRPGAGVDMTLRVPLTLALTPALVLRCGGERYLLAQHHVESIETLTDQSPIDVMPDALRWRDNGENLAAARLGALLGVERAAPPASEVALKMRTGAERYVLIVDDVEEVQEIVLKPLPAEVPAPPLFAGAAILSDGDVVLGLDATGLADAIGLPNVVSAHVRAQPAERPLDTTFQMLTFEAGAQTRRATPLATVASVELAGPDDFAIADGVAVLWRGDRAVPMVDFPSGAPYGPTPVVVLREGQDYVGVAATAIGDVFVGDFRLDFVGQTPGVLGVANVGGGLAEVLDLFQTMDLSSRRRPAPKFDGRPDVLLVEPSQIAREMFARALRAWGCRVHACADQKSAAEALARRRDFVVSFVALGYADPAHSSLVHAIQAANPGARAPIYGLTADPTQASHAAAARAGLVAAVDRFDRSAVQAVLLKECARLRQGAAA